MTFDHPKIDKVKVFENSTVNKFINKKNYKKRRNISIGKRIFDIFFSFLLIMITSPFMLLIALIIKISTKGPIIYISKRVGTNFYIFNFYKFRTMVFDAESIKETLQDRNLYKKIYDNKISNECPDCKKLGYPCSPVIEYEQGEICEKLYLENKRYELLNGIFFKVDDKEDPRITKIGKIIRKTHLDELPQLFNVIKGDMSLVGNRPLPLDEAIKLTTDEWAYRFLAPSGITGLWQTHKGLHFTEERIALDNQYAMNAGFKYDIKIIWKTILKIFSKKKSNRIFFDN